MRKCASISMKHYYLLTDLLTDDKLMILEIFQLIIFYKHIVILLAKSRKEKFLKDFLSIFPSNVKFLFKDHVD